MSVYIFSCLCVISVKLFNTLHGTCYQESFLNKNCLRFVCVLAGVSIEDFMYFSVGVCIMFFFILECFCIVESDYHTNQENENRVPTAY